MSVQSSDPQPSAEVRDMAEATMLIAECSEALNMAYLNIPGWEDAVDRAQASIRAWFVR